MRIGGWLKCVVILVYERLTEAVTVDSDLALTAYYACTL